MRSAEERLVFDAPEWLGLPMKRLPFGWEWDIGKNEKGCVVYPDAVNYRQGREFVPIPYEMLADHSGGYGYPHDPGLHVLPGGFLSVDGHEYGIRSIGVTRRGQFVPVWKPGAFKIEPLAVVQSVGPYDVRTSFEACGRKQEIILPEMPNVDGEELVIDYWVRGMPPPELCTCKPYALDAKSRVVDLKKRRTELGRIESIPLDVLASLAFPVVLDPETLGSGGWMIQGGSSVYANARNSGSSWGTNTCFRGPGQLYYNSGGGSDYLVSRHAIKWNCNAYSAGTISACFMKAACCSTADQSLASPDYSDVIIFSQADYSAWDPPDLFTIENIYDLIRTSTHGGTFWSMQDAFDKGCVASPNCVDVDWHPFTDPSDVAFMNTQYAVAPPNRNIRAGISGQRDHTATAPTTLETVWQGHRGLCGPKLKFNVGAAGFVWMIGG